MQSGNLFRLALVVLGVTTYSASRADESIAFDSPSGNYRITYCCDEQGNQTEAIFEPWTKVDPRIASVLGTSLNGAIAYKFTISITNQSLRPLAGVIFDPVTSVRTLASIVASPSGLNPDQYSAVRKAAPLSFGTPVGWKAFLTDNHKGQWRLGWNRLSLVDSQLGEFKPGTTQQGFAFGSSDLPGISIVQFTSKATGPRMYSGEGPSFGGPVSTTLQELETNDFVPRFAAAPAISTAGSPNCATLMNRIVAHVQAWPAQLMDGSLSNQIRSSLAYASAACSSPVSSSAAAAYLNDIRALLEHEYPGFNSDTVATMQGQDLSTHDKRLAARVLDFDVVYLLGL